MQTESWVPGVPHERRGGRVWLGSFNLGIFISLDFATWVIT